MIKYKCHYVTLYIFSNNIHSMMTNMLENCNAFVKEYNKCGCHTTLTVEKVINVMRMPEKCLYVNWYFAIDASIIQDNIYHLIRNALQLYMDMYYKDVFFLFSINK